MGSKLGSKIGTAIATSSYHHEQKLKITAFRFNWVRLLAAGGERLGGN